MALAVTSTVAPVSARIAGEQLISVREKIAQLKRLETEIERIASCCDGKTVGDCYVIRALSDHALCADEHG